MSSRIFVLSAVVCGRLAFAQLPIDSQIAAGIAGIKSIDNHAHPVRPVKGSDKDTEYDALPVESLAPSTEPFRTAPGRRSLSKRGVNYMDTPITIWRRSTFGNCSSGKSKSWPKKASTMPNGCWISSASRPCSPTASRWAAV